MSPAGARILLLCSELERDWAEVERHCDRARTADPNSTEHAAAFVALELDHAYQAFESFLARWERGLGLPARSGATWHRSILEDSANPIDGLRPAAVPSTALPDWLMVMTFRHFLRHAYSAELDASRLIATREALERAVAATAPTIRAVIASLRDVD
jgi:hypothetical protein